MFGNRWRIFRVLGIPVSVDASWLVILALLTMSMSGVFPGLMKEYFPEAAARQQPWVYWVMAFVAALAFFACILLHEMGHAVVARSQRMTVRGVTLFLFGGVAEIGDEPPSPRVEFLMALAGPAVTVVLASLLAAAAWQGYQLGWPPHIILFLGYLAAINVVVLTFNLLPAFPLDGGRVLRSILWGMTGDLRKATHGAAIVGQGFAWLLIVWGLLNFFAENWLSGLWIGLIGLFLNNAAQVSYQQLLFRKTLEGEPVRRFMNPQPITVPSSLDLRSWVEDYVYHHHRKAFPVVTDGVLEGLIETRDLARIPRGEWAKHTVDEVMRKDLQGLTISPETDSVEALTRMRRSGSSRLIVTEGNRLVGIVSLKDLLRFLSLKLELEGSTEAPAATPNLPKADGRLASGSTLTTQR